MLFVVGLILLIKGKTYLGITLMFVSIIIDYLWFAYISQSRVAA